MAERKRRVEDEETNYAMLLDFATVHDGFHFAIGGYTDERHRNGIIQRLTAEAADAGVQVIAIDLHRVTTPDPVLLTLCREALEANAADPRRKALSVIGLERHLSFAEGGGRDQRSDFLPTANFQRDAFPKYCPAPLIVWAHPLARNAIALVAPDLWHWRNGTFFFDTLRPDGAPPRQAEMLEALIPRPEHPDHYQPTDDAAKRLALLRELLKPDADPPATGERRCYILLDLADCLERAADYPGAKAAADEALGIAQGLNDARLQASAWHQLGRVAHSNGDYGEALRLWRDEALPRYRALGDRRNAAAAQSMIAAVLQRQGDWPEARRLLREEVLPVWREMKDDSALAIDLGKLANILMAEGKHEEALELIRQEQTPLLERLRDQRGLAQAAYDSAHILYRLRRHDEALLSLREQALPGARQVGDRQGEAAALGLMALILHGQGQSAEALRLLRDEVLPLPTKMGDARGVAATQINIAAILLATDPQVHGGEARALLTAARAYFAAQNTLPQLQQIDAMLAEIGPPPDGAAAFTHLAKD